MLKIPKEVDYGILILLALMDEGNDQLVAATKMAEITKLPYQQVAKLLKKLQKGGVIESFRGPKGGYRLLISPEELTLNEVYTFFFGALSLTDCTKKTEGHQVCRVKGTCSLVPHMEMINEAMEEAFSKITLAKINKKNKEIVGIGV